MSIEIFNAYKAQELSINRSSDITTEIIIKLNGRIKSATKNGEFSASVEISDKQELVIERVMKFYRAKGYSVWYSPPLLKVSWTRPERLENE